MDPYTVAEILGIIFNVLINLTAIYIGYKKKNYPVMVLIALNHYWSANTIIAPIFYIVYESISYLIEKRKAVKT